MKRSVQSKRANEELTISDFWLVLSFDRKKTEI